MARGHAIHFSQESVELRSLEVGQIMVTPLAALIDSMFSPKSVLRLLYLFAFLPSAATADTQITFPSFSPESNGDFFSFGDAAYDLANRSYILNIGARTPASKGSCGVMVYGKPVRIQKAATGSVASFSTSFSFTFTTHGLPWDNRDNPLDGSIFGFSFLENLPMTTIHDVVSEAGTFGACTTSRPNAYALDPSGFAVRFHTDYSPIHCKDPSNNFIRVARNSPYEYDIEAYTHNLCGNDTHCTYFSNGRTFTAWIAFTSSSQTLEVRMANGSNAKPLQPLLLISNYEFPKSIGDKVLVTFWGSSDVNRREEHEILSWSFFSTDIPESKLQIMLHHWKSRTGVGVTTGGALVGTMAALVILWSIYSFATPSSSYSALEYSTGPHVFSYKELRKATENFGERNLLGRGGSGLVYKGSLEGGGVLVAVKQMNMSESKQAESLFHAEVTSLGQIRHRNVVRLHGWCQEKGKLLLVYEYMSNGTLHQWLHGGNGSQQVLSLKRRHSILEGVCAALEYLHEDCSSCILHRDIKSSNVLLDADFKAYVGDFGLARLMDHHKLDKTTLTAGTFGYMAPELPYTGKATKKSDVYSFGILVLEVVCGRHPLDLRTEEPEDLVLLFTVWRAHEDGSLYRLADPRMVTKACQPSCVSTPLSNETTYTTQVPSLPSISNNLNCSTAPPSMDVHVNLEMIQTAKVVSLLQLGLFCCLPNPKARPSMEEVNRLLQQIQDIGDESPIMTIPMPSLPTTKPPGVYHSLSEFSHSDVLSTLVAPPPTSLV